MKKRFTLFLAGILVIIMTIPSSASYYPGIEGGIIDGGTLTDGEIIQFIWELYGIVPEDVSKSTDDATTLFAELGILTALNPAWWVNARKGTIDLTDDNVIALKEYAFNRFQRGDSLVYNDLIFINGTSEYTIDGNTYTFTGCTPYVILFAYNGGISWSFLDTTTPNIAYSNSSGGHANSSIGRKTNKTTLNNKSVSMYTGTLYNSWNINSLPQQDYNATMKIAASIFNGEIVPESTTGAINRGSFGNVLDRKKEGELKDADPVIIGEFGNSVIDIQPEKVRELVNGAVSGIISNTDVLAQTGTIPLVLEQDKYYPLTDTGVSDIPYEFPDVPASGFTLSGLEELFPFCIPFDIYDMLSVLAAEPESPKFTWVLPFNGNNYEYEVDLSEFDTVAQVARTVMILCFCLWLAIKTRDLIRG